MLKIRNAVSYDCRDVAIFLRQLKFKKSQSTHTFHKNKKKFSNLCLFLKEIGKTKLNHEVFGLRQRSLHLHDVIDFWRNWPFISLGSGMIKIFLLLLNRLHSRQKYRSMRGRHPSVNDVWKFKTESVCFQIESNSHLSDDNYWKTLTSILRQHEKHEQIETMANHGPFCRRIKNDKENIL